MNDLLVEVIRDKINECIQSATLTQLSNDVIKGFVDGLKHAVEIIEKAEMKDDEEQFKRVGETWGKGEHTYDGAMRHLVKLKPGERIGDLVKHCTICPIRNATCASYMEWKLYGFNPAKGGKEFSLMVCAMGVEGDGEKCHLNK